MILGGATRRMTERSNIPAPYVTESARPVSIEATGLSGHNGDAGRAAPAV